MDFKEMTLLQLKAYAKEKGIRGISTLKKEQLVEKLMKSEKYEEKREENKGCFQWDKRGVFNCTSTTGKAIRKAKRLLGVRRISR